MRQKINNTDIADEFVGCAYCGTERPHNRIACCGEVHYETYLELNDGSVVALNEVEVVNEEKTGLC